MIQVESKVLWKLLTRAARPVTETAYGLKVTASLWKRLSEFAASFPAPLSRSHISPTSALAEHVFDLGKTHSEKAVIGSILVENGFELSSLLESKYLHALVEAGLSPRALEIWLAKQPTTLQERKHWSRLGVLLYCSCFRAILAENLLAKERIEIDSEICLAFVRVYSELKSEEGLNRWIAMLEKSQASAHSMNVAIEYIATAGLWSQVQIVVESMSRRRQKVNSDMLALCATSSVSEGQFSLVATLLSEDGGLVNVRRFREFLARDPRTKVSNLLEEVGLSQAVEFVLNESSGRKITLSYQILKHFSSLSKPVQQTEIKYLMPLFIDVSNHPNKNSHFIQFMLRFYQIKGDYESFWSFASDFELLTTSPSIAGKLSKSNYVLLWKALSYHLKPNSASRRRDRAQPASVNLRQFVVATVSNMALTDNLLGYVLLSLGAIPDLPAIVCLLEFINVVYGITIRDEFLDALKEIHNADSYYPSVNPNEFIVVGNQSRSCWEIQARQICSAHNADFELMREQSAAFRKQLCFPDHRTLKE